MNHRSTLTTWRVITTLGAAMVILSMLALVLAPAARAASTTATASFGPIAAPATEAVSLDQCDPANGELVSVALSVEGEVSIEYNVENLGAVPTLAAVATDATIMLAPPVGAALSGAAQTSQDIPLDPFDGTIDFDGPSGEEGVLTSGASANQNYTMAADLAPFSGTGTVSTTLDFTGQVTTSFPGGNGFGGGTNSVTGTVTLVCNYVDVPSIDVEKATNGEDADAAPGPEIVEGDAVVWTYIVTNDGETPLESIALTDDVLGAVSCPQTTLGVGESMTCTVEGVAVEGPYVNNASVVGTDPASGESVDDEDPSNYLGLPARTPAIDVEKSTNGEDADSAPGPLIAVGDTVTWTYVVSNTGETELSDIALTDDVLGAITCPADTLPLGESMTCTAEGVATAGPYTNTASVTASGPRGEMVSDEDPSNYFGADPSVDVEKSTNGQDADAAPGPSVAVGDPVTWTYVVTNTGNTPLTDVTVTDDQVGAITCPADTLGVDEEMTCTAEGVATVGPYTNTATVSAVDPTGVDVTDDDPSNYFGPNPSLDVEKTTNGRNADQGRGPDIPAGDPVEWRFVITNDGNTPVTDIELVDDVIGVIECPADNLDIGESMTCTAEGVATVGPYTNLATVTGVGPNGEDVTDDDPSAYFGTRSGIDVEKSTNGEDADTGDGPTIDTGGVVTWTYVVTNVGNVRLTDVAVSDDQVGDITCPATELGPGASMTCEAVGEAVQGPYTNTATATGTDPYGDPVEDDDPSRYVGLTPGTPSIDVEKTTNGVDADEGPGPQLIIGSTVLWTYTVTNNGDLALDDVLLTDNLEGDIVCPEESLEPGESMVCGHVGTVAAGLYRNVAFVSGTDINDVTVNDNDPSHYEGIEAAPDIVAPTPIPATPIPATPVPAAPTPIPVAPVAPAPPVVIAPTPAPIVHVVPAAPPAVPVKKKAELAHTGNESLETTFFATAILGVGMVVLGISYRRREEQQA